MPYQGLDDAHEASLYRALVRNLPEYGIFRIGVNSRLESWNQGIERLLGYTEREFVTLHFAELFLPEDREQNVPEQELCAAAQEGRASDTRWHLRKNGTRFFCDGMVTPIWGESGQLLGFTEVMQDITSRKLVEQEMWNLCTHST